MTGLLSRRGAEALVSKRLASLGHGADFITDDAVDTLRARAGHEADALGAALGAVLFLAATEDAPRIESRHVEQAVPLAETRALAASGLSRALQIVAAIALGAALGAATALLLTPRPAAVAPHLAVPVPAPKPQIAAPHQPVIVAALAPKAPPPPALPAPPIELPVAPPLRVSVVVPAGDRETISRFTSLAAMLRKAGPGDVQLQTINSAKMDTRALRHHVVYFFDQDAFFAKNLAATLDSAEDSSHSKNPWVPILVIETAGSSSHPPGSIDIFAP